MLVVEVVPIKYLSLHNKLNILRFFQLINKNMLCHARGQACSGALQFLIIEPRLHRLLLVRLRNNCLEYQRHLLASIQSFQLLHSQVDYTQFWSLLHVISNREITQVFSLHKKAQALSKMYPIE
ncbi:hypothetical protein PGLA_11765 [Paenibacillus glacialis]|uniref:Uncharacterized protein n=1 Tax=Paenibacillus glacialis TaxID=494026 RepID=A0A168KR14_9BACL|nr:hypothetical protein PGLA_11765 [Paenibacillus glacialis]